MKRMLRQMITLLLVLSLVITPSFAEEYNDELGPVFTQYSQVYEITPTTIRVVTGKTISDVNIHVNQRFTNVESGFYDSEGSKIVEDVELDSSMTYKISSDQVNRVYNVEVLDPSTLPPIAFHIGDTAVIGDLDTDTKVFTNVKSGITVKAFKDALIYENSKTSADVYTSDYSYLFEGDIIENGDYIVLLTNKNDVEKYTFSVGSSSGTKPTPEASLTIVTPEVVADVSFETKTLTGVMKGIAVGDLLAAINVTDGSEAIVINSENHNLANDVLLESTFRVILTGTGDEFSISFKEDGNPTQPLLITIKTPEVVESVDNEKGVITLAQKGIPVGDLLSALTIPGDVGPMVINAENIVMKMDEIVLNNNVIVFRESSKTYRIVSKDETSTEPTPTVRELSVIDTDTVESIDYENNILFKVKKGITVGELLSALSIYEDNDVNVIDRNNILVDMKAVLEASHRLLIPEFNSTYYVYFGEDEPAPVVRELVTTNTILVEGIDYEKRALINVMPNIAVGDLLSALRAKNDVQVFVINERGFEVANDTIVDGSNKVIIPDLGVDYKIRIKGAEPTIAVLSITDHTIISHFNQDYGVLEGIKFATTVGEVLAAIEIRDNANAFIADESGATLSLDAVVKTNYQLKIPAFNKSCFLVVDSEYKNAPIITKNSKISYDESSKTLFLDEPMTFEEVVEDIDFEQSKISDITRADESKENVIYYDDSSNLICIFYPDKSREYINVTLKNPINIPYTSGITQIELLTKSAFINAYDSYYDYDSKGITNITLLSDDDSVVFDGNKEFLSKDILGKSKKAMVTFDTGYQVELELKPWYGAIQLIDSNVATGLMKSNEDINGIKTGITIKTFDDALTLSDGVSVKYYDTSGKRILNTNQPFDKNVVLKAFWNGTGSTYNLNFDLPLTSVSDDVIVSNIQITIPKPMLLSELEDAIRANTNETVKITGRYKTLNSDSIVNSLDSLIVATDNYSKQLHVSVQPNAFRISICDVTLEPVRSQTHHISKTVVSNEDNSIITPFKSTVVYRVSALDSKGRLVNDLSNLEFTLQDGSSIPFDHETKELTVFLDTVRTEPESYNFTWNHQGQSKNIFVSEYQGALGYFDIESMNNKKYSGDVTILTNGKIGDSYFTDTMITHAVEGKVYVPIDRNLVNLSTLTIVLVPRKMGFANSEPIELLDYFSVVKDDEIVKLGDVSFNNISHVITALREDGTTIESGTAFVQSLVNMGDGSGMNLLINLPIINGHCYFNWVDEYTDNISISFSSNDIEETSFKAQLNKENGDVTLQEGSSNIFVSIINQDGSAIDVDDPGWENLRVTLAEYQNNKIVAMSETRSGVEARDYCEFKEGEEYTFSLYLSIMRLSGKSRAFTITYHSEAGEYQGSYNNGEKFSYRIDENGKVYCSIPYSPPVLSGYVRASGEAINDIQINVYDIATNKRVGDGLTHSVVIGDNKDEHGYFSITSKDNLNGEYRLECEAPGNSLDYFNVSQIVTLPSNEPIVLELTKASMKGKIHVAPEDVVKYDNKIQRVYVNVFDLAGNYVTNGRVRSNGDFSIPELAPGPYYAEAFVSGFSPLAQDYMSSDKKTFLVNEGEMANIDITLNKTIGNGLVVNSNNEPTSTWVRIYDSGMNNLEYVHSNDQGQFSLPFLPDGEYLIKALGDGSNTFDSIAKTLTISDAQSSDVSLTLTSSHLSGRVSGQNGHVDGANVYIYTDEMKYVSSAKTDENGRYILGRIPNGDYLIQVTPESITDGASSQYIAIEVTNQPLVKDIALKEVNVIGTANNSFGERLSNGWVTVYEDGKYVTSAKVDKNGQFGLHVTDKETEIVLQGAGGFFLNSNRVSVKQSDKTVIMSQNSEYSVAGRLKGYTGNEIVNVYLYDANKKAIGKSTVNAFGVYKFAGLANGKYFVVVAINGDVAEHYEIDYSGEAIFNMMSVTN